ncbi:fumarate reductase flavoprotein subunit [Rhizobiales bacterium GAS191]|jgi:fumarate reductase flavoprotein subunit|nr:fumarate reductase flavoprotein subunit [Rhizobiales bacterium GAS113]SEE83523.1 fumarate reductase flavoprotein subunit [Rhizobiales bacterium GAS191]
MTIKPAAGLSIEAEIPVLIIGGGAAGLCAALAAREAGADCAILERDAVPRGSTALSAGLIPAAGTRFQRLRGIDDDAALFAADIMGKAKGEPDTAIVDRVTRASGPLIEWLADRHHLPFSLVHDFDYPGHSARRMHGLPSRSGAELVDRLRGAVEAMGIPILTSATVTALHAEDDGRVRAVEVSRPDGSRETIGCAALILACSGYGGNRELVCRHIPEMADAIYFGHAGNRGDAVLWGGALGAKLAAMSGYQGHGSVAAPHGILITWATITEGGFQVDGEGQRFSNEAQGYSEQAEHVLTKAKGVAFNIFDERIAAIARQFEDFREAEAVGAVLTAPTVEVLAERTHLPPLALAASFAGIEAMKRGEAQDPFGRDFRGAPPLCPPYKAVRVTGALFHTQGGLVIDEEARVLREDGTALPNLFASGGAACGVSGSTAAGYLSGNGLLTATVLGRMAGRSATALALAPS